MRPASCSTGLGGNAEHSTPTLGMVFPGLMGMTCFQTAQQDRGARGCTGACAQVLPGRLDSRGCCREQCDSHIFSSPKAARCYTEQCPGLAEACSLGGVGSHSNTAACLLPQAFLAGSLAASCRCLDNLGMMAGDLPGADAVTAVSKAFSQGSQKNLLFSAAFQAAPSLNSSPEVVPLAQLGSPQAPSPLPGKPLCTSRWQGKGKASGRRCKGLCNTGACSSPGTSPSARAMNWRSACNPQALPGARRVPVQLPAPSTPKTNSCQQGRFHGNGRVTQDFGTGWKTQL